MARYSFVRVGIPGKRERVETEGRKEGRGEGVRGGVEGGGGRLGGYVHIHSLDFRHRSSEEKGGCRKPELELALRAQQR